MSELALVFVLGLRISVSAKVRINVSGSVKERIRVRVRVWNLFHLLGFESITPWTLPISVDLKRTFSPLYRWGLSGGLRAR